MFAQPVPITLIRLWKVELCVYAFLLFLSPVSEYLVSEDGGQNISISDAFIKGRNSPLTSVVWLQLLSSCVYFLLNKQLVLNLMYCSCKPSYRSLFAAESLFNRRVEEKANEVLFTPLGWHHSSLDQLREENGEKEAMERLL